MDERKIVKIDEELCDGCGQCVPACAEGAIRIVGGKARLVADRLCDGLGACLGECPRGAISIETRPAEEFDHEAVRRTLHGGHPEHRHGAISGCPSAAVRVLRPAALSGAAAPAKENSALGHWPVKLRLFPPEAPFLSGADLVLAADCVPVAMAAFNPRFLSEKAVVIGCPKFDDGESALERLAEILARGGVRSLTVAVMEVPCCFGYRRIAEEAIARSGREIPLHEVIVRRDGSIQELSSFGAR